MQDQLPRAATTANTSPILHYMIGQDEAGHWLALECGGRKGGVFKSRADAIHFAAFETGHEPGAIELAPQPLRLAF